MDDNSQPGWEPDPRKMGNWQSMFEKGGAQRSPGAGPLPASGSSRPGHDEGLQDEPLELDMAEYKPWVLQRGRSRPAMMLHLRRFEPKSASWIGWQLSYPHLIAVEYIGEKMLSLDFGRRQYIITGKGLDGLFRHFESGSVVLIQEHAPSIWPATSSGPIVNQISLVE